MDGWLVTIVIKASFELCSQNMTSQNHTFLFFLYSAINSERTEVPKHIPDVMHDSPE